MRMAAFWPTRSPTGEVAKVGFWVELGGSTLAPRTAGIGASRRLLRIPAIVPFLNPQPPLSLVGGNRSSCPKCVIGEHAVERRGQAPAAEPAVAQALTFPAARTRRVSLVGTPNSDLGTPWAGCPKFCCADRLMRRKIMPKSVGTEK